MNPVGEGALPPLVPDEIAGVGPHPTPWPDDDRYDPDLLAEGDRRNVADRYRYWKLDAIVADLDTRRHDFAVAIENWQYDLNIGSIVRTANAFLAAEVIIVGQRRWNRRGAMVTERYQHVRQVETVDDLVALAHDTGRELVGVDNTPGSEPLERAELPRRALFVFGQEGPGLSPEASAAAGHTLSIAQYGSTRSINAAVAAGIVMHSWIRRHADDPPT